MELTSERENVLANCKFIYGKDTEIVTFSIENSHQAVAIRFDPFTGSWTKFLHSKEEAGSTNQALKQLLAETEVELAKLFSSNGIALPFSGDSIQRLTLNRGLRSHAATSSSSLPTISEFELSATTKSTVSEEAILENAPDEAKATKSDGEMWHEEPAVEEYICEVVPKIHEVGEALSEKSIPLNEEPTLDGLALVDLPEHPQGDEPLTIEEPVPEPEPEKTGEDEVSWGTFGTAKKGKKKAAKIPKRKESKKKDVKKKSMAFENPNYMVDPEAETRPATEEPKCVEEQPIVEDPSASKQAEVIRNIWPESVYREDGLEPIAEVISETPQLVEGFCLEKSFCESSKIYEEPPQPEAEPQSDIFEITPKPKSKKLKGKKEMKGKKGKNIKTDDKINIVEEVKSIPEELQPTVQTYESSSERQQAEDIVITIQDTSPSENIQPKSTTQYAQLPAGQTIVLTILQGSKKDTPAINTMVNLAENSKPAIIDAVHSHLDSKSLMVPFSGQREVEVKSGTGKNGEIDLSNVEDSKWPEYLVYLQECTKLPELTVVVWGYE